MGSVFLSLSAARGLSGNVEPSLSVAVYGSPWAAAEPDADAAGADESAGATLAVDAAGAVVGAAPVPHAATSRDAAPAIAIAPRDPIRMVISSSRTGCLGASGGRQYRFQRNGMSTLLERFAIPGRCRPATPR